MILPGLSNGKIEMQTGMISELPLSEITSTEPITMGAFLPPAGDYDGPGVAVGVSVSGGNLTDAWEILNSSEMITALQQQADIKYGQGESVPVGGPTTRGSIITIAGRNIQMPDTVEIDGVVTNLMCQVGMPCMETPAYALLNTETGHYIGVGINSGMVGDPGLPEDELAAIRSEFQWLVDALVGVSPTSPVATPETEVSQ